MKFYLTFIAVSLLAPSQSFGGEQRVIPYDYIEKNADLLITDKRISRTYVFENVKSYDNLTIVLPMDPKAANNDKVQNEDIDVTAELEKAREFYGEGQYQDAWDSLQKANRKNPKKHETKTMMGSIQVQFGNKEKAIKYYKQSLKLEPDQPDVKSELKRLEAE